MALTAKRRLFVDCYIACGLNASEAARRAGYKEENARQMGYEILQDADVKAEIEGRFSQSAMSAKETLHRLKEQATGTIEDFVQIGIDYERLSALEEDLERTEGMHKNISLSDETRAQLLVQINDLKKRIDDVKEHDIRLDIEKAKAAGKLHLIKKLKPGQYGMELELHDAHAALVDIGRAHKLFAERIAFENADENPFKVYVSVDVENV